MRKYKLVLLLKSDIKKDKKEKLVEDVKKWSGKVTSDKLSDLGERKLAYPIKGEKKGEYSLLEFEIDSLAADLEKRLLVQEEILRHLLIRVK